MNTGSSAGPAVAPAATRSRPRGFRRREGHAEFRLERRDSVKRRLLAAVDLLAVLAAALIVGFQGQGLDLFLAVLPTLPGWLLVFKLYNLYDRDVKRMTHSSLDDLPGLLHALLVCMLGLWAWTNLLLVQPLTFDEMLVFCLVTLGAVLPLRWGVRRFIPKAFGPERVLLAGPGSTMRPLVRKFEQKKEHGLVAVGRLRPDGPTQHDSDLEGLVTVGDVGDLASAANDLQATRLVIDRPSFSSTAVLEMVQVCRSIGMKVSILPGAVDALGPATEVDGVDGITVLGLNPPVLGRTSRWLKRGFDLTIAVPLAVLMAPVFPVVALAIKLDSPGPVFFAQTRVGRGGNRFRLWKLRTMVVNAEASRAGLLCDSRDPNWLLLDHDPRVTRIGRFLRASSIDETPQLWNVITGKMSLVGPRPLPEDEDARIDGWERTRLDLTPGITGLWQVLGRTRIPFAEMVKLDYIYVTNWSLWLDTKLLLQTLPTVLRRHGAN